MNQKEIGKFIAFLRKKKNLTQEQLAEKLGVNNRTVSRWENGNYMPDLAILIPLSEVLNISIYELLSGTEIKIKNKDNIIDYQIRFCYGLTEEKKLLEKIMIHKDIVYKGIFFEETIQYDQEDAKKSFYRKENDSRLRIRLTKNSEYEKAIISYKKRQEKENINKEEEINIEINSKDFKNIQKLFENILYMRRVESYERYIHVFENDQVKIVLIRYPFMITLEIINLSEQYKEETIMYWLKKLNLNINNCYKLSWDDKYKELCLAQNKIIEKDVTFNKEMPKFKN